MLHTVLTARCARLRLALAAGAIGSFAAGASSGESQDPAAQQAQPQLTWHCWYNAPVHVSCVLAPGGSGAAAHARVESAPPTARPLPAIVGALRTDPQAFRNRFLHIPLHAVPFDMHGVAQLARAVVCGGHASCTMRLVPPSWAELERVMDPVLASATD